MCHARAASVESTDIAVEAAADVDDVESVAALGHLAATLPRSQVVVVLLIDVFDFQVAEAADQRQYGGR